MIAVTWLRSLVAGFSLRKPGFSHRSVRVGFVVGKVALGRLLSEFFGFLLSIFFHPELIASVQYNFYLSNSRAVYVT
jgi:cytochrome b subunit of formate dehydrogenase